MAGLQVGRREIDGLVRTQGQQRALQLGQQAVGRPRLRARRRDDRAGAVVGRVPLVLGGVLDERGGDEQQLEAVRMLEGVVEPGQRVAVLVAVLRHGEVVRRAGLQDVLRGGDLDGVEDPPRRPAAAQARDQRLDHGELAAAGDRVHEHRLLGRAERGVLGEQLAIAAVEEFCTTLQPIS